MQNKQDNITFYFALKNIPERNLQEVRENLFPVIKSEIKIRENLFPARNTKIRHFAKLNSRENFMLLSLVTSRDSANKVH